MRSWYSSSEVYFLLGWRLIVAGDLTISSSSLNEEREESCLRSSSSFASIPPLDIGGIFTAFYIMVISSDFLSCEAGPCLSSLLLPIASAEGIVLWISQPDR